VSAIQDDERVRAEWWCGEDGSLDHDGTVWLEVDRDEAAAGRVAIHTIKSDGTGSHASYYLDRESAIEMAGKILNAVRFS
jgi:hypothetical protein